MRIRQFVAGAAVALISAAAPAFAHAGFLVPLLDESDTSGKVLLNATFSDTFPEAEIALRSDVWTIITPTGEPKAFDKTVSDASRTVLRAYLLEEGTYRLSSGERLGRTGEVARIDGAFIRLGSDGVAKADLPKGAEIMTSQTATVSDIYLSRGTPGAGMPDSRIGRLAIVPVSDPSVFAPGDRLTFTIEFDDEPLSDMPVTAFVPGGSREEGAPDTTLLSDANGQVSLSCETKGAHLLMVRHLSLAPEGAETDVRSYTTTLTLNCTAGLSDRARSSP